MVAFRELQRDDLPFLVSVRNECRAMLHDDSEFTLAQAQQWFDSKHPRFYIATEGGKPIGYFRTSNWEEPNRRVYVGFDLHKDYRGKGLAQAAYRVFLRHLFVGCGMNKVSLEVLEHNERAMCLYQRLGFALEGVKRQDVWRDGRYLDNLLFSMLKSEFNAHYGSGDQRGQQSS